MKSASYLFFKKYKRKFPSLGKYVPTPGTKSHQDLSQIKCITVAGNSRGLTPHAEIQSSLVRVPVVCNAML